MKVELLLDDAIITVENECFVTIGELSGSDWSKSITVDKKFVPVIKDLGAITGLAGTIFGVLLERKA